MSDPNSRFQELKAEYEAGNAAWDESADAETDDGADRESDDGADRETDADADRDPDEDAGQEAEERAESSADAQTPAVGTLDTAEDGTADGDADEFGDAAATGESDVEHTFEQLKARLRGDDAETEQPAEPDGRGDASDRSADSSGRQDRPLELDETRRLPNGEVLTADFIASFVAGGEGSFDPVQGRVLMSDARLVLARNDSKTVVPIEGIFDLSVGQVPPEVAEFFDQTLTIGYVRDGRKQRAIVGGDRSKINDFSLMLFRGVIDGTAARLVHPAVIGGRQLDTSAEVAKVQLDPDAVNFHVVDGETTTIELPSVVGFEVAKREIDGASRLAFQVKHVQGTEIVTSEISMGSRRKMHVLGRYLRMTYAYLRSELRDVDLTEREMETVTAIYSAGAGVDIGGLLGVDDDELDRLLEGLVEQGVVSSASDPELSPTGRMVVIREIEEVNL